MTGIRCDCRVILTVVTEETDVYRDVLAAEIEAVMARRWGVQSKRELARKLGMNYETLRSRLDRRTSFTAEEIWSLCRRLGIDAHDLMEQVSLEYERRLAPASDAGA